MCFEVQNLCQVISIHIKHQITYLLCGMSLYTTKNKKIPTNKILDGIIIWIFVATLLLKRVGTRF